jgi:enoyl-CoA hydratase/carnithine racemase
MAQYSYGQGSMEIDTGTNELLCVVHEGVALITLNRPEARNAMSDKLTPALRTQIKERGDDPNVGAILITGAGTAFCSGGDVKSMGGRSARTQLSFEDRLIDLRWRQANLTGALVALRKPTIAALPGAAAGAGLAVALACDIRVAAKSAFVSTGYARVGLSGDYGIAWLLTRAVGSARARELMFTAERVDAERGERIGLINRVVDDTKLQDEAFALARSLAEGPRAALALIKDNLDDALHIDYPTALYREAERLVRASRTADHKEAVAAFVEKRKAVFTGR